MDNGHDQAHLLVPDLVGDLPHLVFACSGLGERIWSGPQWTGYTGLSGPASLGLGWLDAIHPDDRENSLRAWASTAEHCCVEHRIWRAVDGAYRWHRTVAARGATPGGTGRDHWIGGSCDVDALHERLLRADNDLEALRGFTEGVPQLLWRSSDGGDWHWASPQWLDFTGQTQADSQGRGWLDAVHPDDRDGALRAWDEARPHGRLDATFRVRGHRDGLYLWHRTRALPVRDADGHITEWRGSTTDVQDLHEMGEHLGEMLAGAQRHAAALEAEVGERQRVEAQLLFDAHHDRLTTLHSRAFLLVRLAEALEAGGDCAILLLDLDRFKLVNNSLGHDTGNALLVEVAKRLRFCVRDRHATLARLGSDEFAILLHGIGGMDAAMGIAEGIVASIRRPFRLEQQEVFSSCRLGLAHATDGNTTPEAILRDADIAMYRAQRGGGCVVFTEAMRADALEAFALRTDLRRALAQDELRILFQPICDAGSRRILGVEALVRWQHPSRGLVPPDDFIRIAEEMGLIREIDGWVLDEACRQMHAWRERFPELDLYLNVNRSGAELKHDRFTTDVMGTLERTGLDPHLLQLEVTENVFLQHPDRIGAILDRIRHAGIRVALDDFGTGYSSLSYLDRYRFDTVKIDRSFVSGLQARPSAAAIVQTIVRLGHDMGLGVVAEGVEDDNQLQALRAAGCYIVQGFLLGRPANAADMTTALARQHDAVTWRDGGAVDQGGAQEAAMPERAPHGVI